MIHSQYSLIHLARIMKYKLQININLNAYTTLFQFAYITVSILHIKMMNLSQHFF